MNIKLISFLTTTALFFPAGCTTNPATGRAQLDLLSTQEEVQLGAEAKPQLVNEYGGEVPSQQLRSYISQIGMDLAQYTEGESPSLPWDFTVVDSDTINAFALPGGKVFMSRGLLDNLDSEAAVAAVLGHEIGHVVAEHVDERMSWAMGLEATTQVAGSVAGGYEGALADLVPVVVGLGGQGYLLKFSRDQESESDELGLRYMVRAGYSPQGLLNVLRVLAEASQGSRGWEMLATHPNPETRLQRVQELIANQYPGSLQSPNLRMYYERFNQQAAPYLSLDSFGSSGVQKLASVNMWCHHCNRITTR